MTPTFNKAVAARTGLSEEEVRRIRSNERAVMQKFLVNGDSVTIMGFGTLYGNQRKGGESFGRTFSPYRNTRFREGVGLQRALRFADFVRQLGEQSSSGEFS